MENNKTNESVVEAGNEVVHATVKSEDAVIHVVIRNDHLLAEAIIDPPVGEGKDVTEEEIRAAISAEKITFGIDEEGISSLAKPLYNQKVTVAHGQAAVDGVDGVCTEKFSRTVEKKFKTREDNSVDYRELGLINEVRAGTLICECTAPTEGVDGITVHGKSIKSRDGRKAIAPVGENIKTSEDGLRSEAAVSGNLVFRDNRFVVETVYRVDTVNYDVGNITFSGDVQVNGDILDGFEIHAGGTVTLRGQVGAVVVEGEHIIIEKGVNGNGKAQISAKKTLKAGFVENCNIFVGEKLTAAYMMHCNVECAGDVEVFEGKGIICGGRITTFGSVKAKTIGNESHTPTVFILGVTPSLQKERKQLQDNLNDVNRHLEEMQKNLGYIERLVADGRPIPPDRVQFLQRTKIQMPMTENKRNQINDKIAELDEKMKDVSHSYLIANQVYPPTKITIGSQTVTVSDTLLKSRIYKSSEGEIVFGKS